MKAMKAMKNMKAMKALKAMKAMKAMNARKAMKAMKAMKMSQNPKNQPTKKPATKTDHVQDQDLLLAFVFFCVFAKFYAFHMNFNGICRTTSPLRRPSTTLQ